MDNLLQVDECMVYAMSTQIASTDKRLINFETGCAPGKPVYQHVTLITYQKPVTNYTMNLNM